MKDRNLILRQLLLNVFHHDLKGLMIEDVAVRIESIFSEQTDRESKLLDALSIWETADSDSKSETSILNE